jgi:hypothetical protein
VIIDPFDVFEQLDAQRADGSLQDSVSGCAVRYQVSVTHPGLLERIGQAGAMTIGRFDNGEFIAVCDETV